MTKKLIKNITKKIILPLILATALLAPKADAGNIITNLAAFTNIVWSSAVSVYQIDVISATPNVLRIYDSRDANLTNAILAYTVSSNATRSITNLVTNAVYVYATSTQYLIQTNIYVNANWRTNYTFPGSSNIEPLAATILVPAAGVASLTGVDMQFVKGIGIVATNTCTVNIYTRP